MFGWIFFGSRRGFFFNSLSLGRDSFQFVAVFFFSARGGISIRARLGSGGFFSIPTFLQFVARSGEASLVVTRLSIRSRAGFNSRLATFNAADASPIPTSPANSRVRQPDNVCSRCSVECQFARHSLLLRSALIARNRHTRSQSVSRGRARTPTLMPGRSLTRPCPGTGRRLPS